MKKKCSKKKEGRLKPFKTKLNFFYAFLNKTMTKPLIITYLCKNFYKMELLDKLKWRYAAKAMNGEKVSDEKVEKNLESSASCPTSSGLHFEIFCGD